MAASSLVWYKNKANKLLRSIKTLKQKDIAIQLNCSQQNVSYLLNNYWKRELPKIVLVLDLAGYEIKEKENV